MPVGEFGDFAASGRAFDEALFDEERLVNLLDGACVFSYGCGYRVDSHGASLELVDDGGQDLVVYLVETIAIYVEGLKCDACYIEVDAAVSLDLREVADASEQCVGDTRCATTAAGNLAGGFEVDGYAQDAGRTHYDLLQGVGIVVLKVHVDAEACSQGSCEQAAACGGSHKREGRQIYLDASCRGTFVDHDVDTVILHGRVEVFLHDG